jgi:hypothetical protein
MPRTARSNSSSTSGDEREVAPQNEEPRGDLDFADDEGRSRVGDRNSDQRLRDEFPDRRVREAGRTGGEMRGVNASDDDVTADDVAPETLLDEERSHTPDAAGREPADQDLRTTDETTIGAGGGFDEAELADRVPVGNEEAARLKHKAERHARDPNAFEPHEAEETAARKRERR